MEDSLRLLLATWKSVVACKGKELAVVETLGQGSAGPGQVHRKLSVHSAEQNQVLARFLAGIDGCLVSHLQSLQGQGLGQGQGQGQGQGRDYAVELGQGLCGKVRQLEKNLKDSLSLLMARQQAEMDTAVAMDSFLATAAGSSPVDLRVKVQFRHDYVFRELERLEELLNVNAQAFVVKNDVQLY